jgi:hypothetical protein
MKTLANVANQTEVRQRIAGLTASDQRLWGSMTVGQMVCHCMDAYLYALGERAAAPVEKPIPRQVMKWMALSSPVVWPKNVQTVPEMNQTAGAGTPPTEFAADRTGLLQAFERFVEKDDDWPPHSMFGPMTREDWMRWGFLHMDHHLRQFGR